MGDFRLPLGLVRSTMWYRLTTTLPIVKTYRLTSTHVYGFRMPPAFCFWLIVFEYLIAKIIQ